MRSRTGVAAGMGSKNFVRAKVTLRAKWARVNSVFLVQLRKKTATDFCGLSRIGQRLKDTWFHHWMARVRTCGRVSQEKSGRVGSPNVHRACTGNAERQWLVGRGQWAVLRVGCWVRVFGLRFASSVCVRRLP